MSGPLVQAIGWALLHLLWQGVLVAAILAAALALLQRQSANARYLAACGALLLLVALGFATGYRAYQPQPSDIVSDVFSRPGELTTVAAPADDVTSEETAATPTATTSTLVKILSFANAHLAQIVAIWLAGVLFLSARLIIGWIGAHRLAKRSSQQAGDQWQRSLYRISVALHLSRSIQLLESAAVEVPTVIGWLRPVILLPVASLSGLSIQQIEMVLAHELAHIRRHDFLVNLMQSVVETLLFYHPAVWWISGRIRAEREHCCDDLAVALFGDPVQYARALTRFEELRVAAPETVLAANGGSLMNRIRRLVMAKAESANWSSRWAAGAALLAVVAAILIAPAVPLFANHEDPQTPKPSAAPKAAGAPEKSKDPSTCDKPATPHATVDVNAEESSAEEASAEETSAEEASDDENSADDGSDEEIAIAPQAVAVVVPRVSVAPIVNASMAMAVEAANEAMAGIEQPTPAPDAQRFRLRIRRKIGESGKLSVDDLITLRNAGVDAKYINEMRSASLGEVSLDDIVAMRLQGVTPGYLKDLRDAGIDVKTADDAVRLRVQGVSGKWIKEMAAAGYGNLPTRELVELRNAGVNPEFVKSLNEAGYTKLTAKELVRLKNSGVDAEFIRELSKYRSK